MKPTLFIAFAILIGLSACQPQATATQDAPPPKALDTTAYLMRGSEISAMAFQQLSSRLKAALEEGGVTFAVPFCSTAALPLMDSLSGVHHATIRRVATRYRNPKNKADEAQAGIIQGMEQALANGTSPQPTIRQFADGKVAFYSPIILGEPCLKCHGEPNADIQSDHLQLIQAFYPQDHATGFALGNVRGMWEIVFSD
jgi:hypothetical protein